jgi:hypothetical protein
LQATGFMKGNVNRWPELHEVVMGNDQLLRRPRSWPNLQSGDDISGNGHNFFFARAPDGRFHDIAAQLSLDQPLLTRGIATADVDGDGRLDYAVANQWGTSYFYHNESDHPGAFLGIRLRLPVGDRGTRTLVCRERKGATALPSRAAIGAEARVFLAGSAPLVQQVDGGNGHSGKRSPDLQFGLGQLGANQLVSVELRWRDAWGTLQRETIQLSPGGWYTILLGREKGVINACE